MLKSLKQKVCKSTAEHQSKSDKKINAQDLYGLESVSYYAAVGAKVMLRVNLCTDFGLVNGSIGTIKDIIYEEGKGSPELPKAIIVDFPGYNGPPLMCSQNEMHSSHDKEKLKWVPITPIQVTNFVNGRLRSRKQIPLRVAYAITIHKSQGLTLDCAYVDISGKNEHGKVFVALSRVKRVSDLVLQGFKWYRYQKIAQNHKSSKLKQVNKAMKSIEKKALYTANILREHGFGTNV